MELNGQHIAMNNVTNFYLQKKMVVITSFSIAALRLLESSAIW